MKNFLKYYFAICMIGISLSGCVSSGYVTRAPLYQEQDQQDQQDQAVTYQSFYDNLSPYGNWIDYPQYGHVWNPRVSAGFRPYASNGQWRYSNDGWAWQSNYNWGWAPFHYGRWLLDDNYGWLWIPGYDWSPAWVTWGRQENNYAWAPLMPEVNVGVQYNNWRPHASYWNIVPREHVGDRNISNIIVHYDHDNNNNNVINSNNTTIQNNTTIINNNTKNITIINNYNTSRTNNYYSKGPEVGEVERYTHTKIQPVAFRDVHQINRSPNSAPNVMEVYRPVVQNPQQLRVQPGGNNNSNIGRNNPAPANQNNTNPGQNTIDRKYKNKEDNNKQVNSALSTPAPIQNNSPVFNNTSGGTSNTGESNPRNNNNTQPAISRPAVQNHIGVQDVNGIGVNQQPANQNQNADQQRLLKQQEQDQRQQQQKQQQQQQLQQQQQQQQAQRQQQQAQRQQQIQRQQAQQIRQGEQAQNQNRNAAAPVQKDGNQNPNQQQAQPRIYRHVEPNQTRPIRNEAQTPVMQDNQQQKNVQRLPVQRAPENKENNRANNRQER